MKHPLIFFTTAIIFSYFLFLQKKSNAQNGNLDISFGNGGKVTTTIGTIDKAWSIAIQSDSKIVLGGYTYNGINYDFALVRYNTNGTLDNSFGNGGIVTTDIDSSEYGYSVAIQSDGKIVLAGSIVNQDFALVRYHTDGTLDNTFGNGGKVISNIAGTSGQGNSIVIQNDGKIVLTGFIHNINDDDMVLIRYNSDGTLDNSFGNGGIQTTDIAGGNDAAYSVALQTDGKIVICGSVGGASNPLAVLRYNTNGTLDNSFGNGGIQTTVCGTRAVGFSVAIQNDGKIVVGAMTWTTFINNDFALLRYNANGTLDNSFGNGGITVMLNDSLDYCRSLAIQNNGKILLGGRSKTATNFDFRIDCYNTNGTLDNSFGNAGTVLTDISDYDSGLSLATQSDGKIVLAGSSSVGNVSYFALARYIFTEDPEGLSTIPNQNLQIKTYPNPFTTKTTFQVNTMLHDATLIIHDNKGQQLKQLQHLYGKEIILYRNHLPTGFYTMQLIQNNKIIAKGTFVIGQ